MTTVPAEEHTVDLVLDQPEADVEPELEAEPLVPIELLMLPGETVRQTLRRLIHEAEDQRLEARNGANWHKRIMLAEAHLPRKQ